MGMYCILAQGSLSSFRSERCEQTRAGSWKIYQEVYIGRQVQDMSWHKAHLERCLQTFLYDNDTSICDMCCDKC